MRLKKRKKIPPKKKDEKEKSGSQSRFKRSGGKQWDIMIRLFPVSSKGALNSTPDGVFAFLFGLPFFSCRLFGSLHQIGQGHLGAKENCCVS
jgi:hypothetical protein